jgi:hypothetical protein
MFTTANVPQIFSGGERSFNYCKPIADKRLKYFKERVAMPSAMPFPWHMHTSLREEIQAKMAAMQRDLDEVTRLELKYGAAFYPIAKASNDGRPHQPKPATKALPFQASADFNLAASSRDAVASIPLDKEFTKNDVDRLIHASYPAATFDQAALSSQMWRLRKAGVIVIVEKGVGLKPSRYRRQPTDDETTV